MAIYTYRCVECDRREEVVQSISSYSVKPNVPECHGKMERYLTSVMVSFDVAPWGAFISPIDGEVIDSKTKRNEHMAKHGVVPFEEVAPDIARNRKRIEEQAVADIKADLVEATHKVEQGYKPRVESVEAIIPE